MSQARSSVIIPALAMLSALLCYAACTVEGNPNRSDTGGASSSSQASGTQVGSGVGGATSTGATSMTSNTAATSVTSGSGGFTCIDINTLSPKVDFPPCDVLDQSGCVCEGCVDDGVCFDQDKQIADDCVCTDCSADTFCTDPMNCNSDGICNPYSEGCGCTDCTDHPLCSGGSGGAGGAGGAGGGGPAWCDLSPTAAHCNKLDVGACICAGCVDDGICYDGKQIDDCVCADCGDPKNPGALYCVNDLGCNNDGSCNPYVEGCGCADCAGVHPSCMGGSGGSGGSGGAGGSP